MDVPFPTFDRSRLRLRPLAERSHDLSVQSFLPLERDSEEEDERQDGPDSSALALQQIAARIREARKRDAAVIMLLGGHVIRAGVTRHLIDLARRGLVTHFAGNGAVAIHDFEIALIGATTESVARYVKEGQFGLWDETGWLNEAAVSARDAGIGWGEATGRMIADGRRSPADGAVTQFPLRDLSLAAACVELGVPFTVHPGIGYDIIHEHPNCDGAAMGAASYTDFLVFARSVQNLEGGVLLNVGSAVMGPEVYLKALAMARNVSHQESREIRHFTTAVFDLVPLSGDLTREAPRTEPEYFYRPWKTILVRTVADGGESFYVRGDHRRTIPLLWRYLCA